MATNNKKHKIRSGTVNFPVGDFLIKVKNTAMAKNKKLTVLANKEIVAIAESLKKLNYLDEVKKEENFLTLSLAFKNKRPVLTNLKLVSKPGLRVYMDVDELSAKRGPSVFLVTTSKGVMSSREAIKNRIGGEVIAEIF